MHYRDKSRQKACDRVEERRREERHADGSDMWRADHEAAEGEKDGTDGRMDAGGRELAQTTCHQKRTAT